MSEHRSILEKLTRLRDQLPTTQLAMERAQGLLDTLNERWFAKYLDACLSDRQEQQDLLQLVEDYANGQHFNEALLHEATKPLTAEEQQLETGRFWAEAGDWQSAAMTEAEARTGYTNDLELWIELLDAKAMDLCQRVKPKPKPEELPPEAQELPKKYQKDKRRWSDEHKTGWGV